MNYLRHRKIKIWMYRIRNKRISIDRKKCKEMGLTTTKNRIKYKTINKIHFNKKKIIILRPTNIYKIKILTLININNYSNKLTRNN